MILALWITAGVFGWLSLGYIGARYVYNKRREYNADYNELGPIGAGLWTFFAGPVGAFIILIQYIIDQGDAGRFTVWDKFFHVKPKKRY